MAISNPAKLRQSLRRRCAAALRCICIALAALAVLPAQAIDYHFPGPTLPPGCNASGDGNYICGALSLAAGDTITIAAPTTIKVVGALTTGASVLINAAGSGADLTLDVSAAVGIGASAIVNANIISGAAIDVGASSTIKGYLRTGTGGVTLGASVNIGGSINTVDGAILIGADSTVGGAIASAATGAVTLGAGVKVGGSISTEVGAVIVGERAIIGGSIASRSSGAVTLGATVRVGGNVSTARGGIDVGAGSSISGSLSSSINGAIGLGASIDVGGNVSTVSGGIDVGAESHIAGSLASTQDGAIALGASLQVGGSVTTTLGAITVGAFAQVDALVSTTGAGAITLGNMAIIHSVCCRVTGDAACVANNTTLPMPPVCPSANTSIASTFAALETGINNPWIASARQALYTRLAGVSFAVDVAALKSDNTLETNYVASAGAAKNIKLELVDGAGSGACSSRAAISPAVEQIVTLTAADQGRKTSASLRIGNAYPNLRWRITDSNQTPAIVGCSSDNFSVRPIALLPAQNTPNLNAGSTFTLQVTALKNDLTIATLYTGTPVINLGQIIGVPGFSAAALAPQGWLAAIGGVSAASFTYDEVGSFTLPASSSGTHGIVDSVYTNVDGAIDCAADSASNMLDSKGQFGCLIGQSVALTVGRFYPDHFDIDTAFAAACTSGELTYMDQPFHLGYTVTAKSLTRAASLSPGNVALKLYSAGQLNLAVVNDNADLLARLAPAVVNPLAPTWIDGSHVVSANYQFLRPVSVTPDASWGAYDRLDIGVAIDDPDGRGYLAATPTFAGTGPAYCLDSSAAECRKYASLTAGATTKMRLGKLRLHSTHGSELQGLSLPLVAQYWRDGRYVTNTADSCTAIPMSSITMGNYLKQLNACETYIFPDGDVTMVLGQLPGAGVRLTRPGPGNAGSVDLALALGATASGNTCVSATPSAASAAGLAWFGANPGARATFGIYRSPFIFRREIY